MPPIHIPAVGQVLTVVARWWVPESGVWRLWCRFVVCIEGIEVPVHCIVQIRSYVPDTGYLEWQHAIAQDSDRRVRRRRR